MMMIIIIVIIIIVIIIIIIIIIIAAVWGRQELDRLAGRTDANKNTSYIMQH